MIFDSHVHLNDPALYQELDSVIQRARKANVLSMNVIGYDLASSKRAVEIARTYEGIYATVGIHPSEVLKMNANDLQEVESLLHHNKVIAVGEIGLDYYWDKSHKEEQKNLFIEQLKMAHKARLPVVLHVRDALQETYDVLVEHKELLNDGGIMHCYSGSAEMAKRFMELGLLIGLGGVITFKNARVAKEVALIVPLESIVLETDAPYLAPHPYRGKQNEPSYLPLVAQEIATLRGIDIEEVERITYANTIKVFRI